MTKIAIPILTALALSLTSGTAMAKGCKNLTGKELKACEKEQKALTKGVALKPSQIDPAWSDMDGEQKNPFNKPKYSVRYEPTKIKKVDNYLVKAAAIKGKMRLSTYVVDQAGQGNVELVSSAGPKLVASMKTLPADAQSLISEGKKLVSDLPKIVTGPDAMKIPKITTGLNGAIANLVSATKEAPATTKALTAVVADPGSAAKGAVK
jgi:hypothetical protein